MVNATSEGCSGLDLIPINQRNPLEKSIISTKIFSNLNR